MKTGGDKVPTRPSNARLEARNRAERAAKKKGLGPVIARRVLMEEG
jgi:hypothetical protein